MEKKKGVEVNRSVIGLLVIDTDEAQRDVLRDLVASVGTAGISTAGAREWRYLLQTEPSIEAVLLGPCDKPETQARLQDLLCEEYPDLPLILCGPRPEPARADGSFVRAVPVPVQPAALADALAEAFGHARRRPRRRRGLELFRSLVGKSEGIRRVRQLVRRVASTDGTVLILGESGTGKEVVARNLHFHSARRGQPFVALDCSAVPAEQLEAEIFGQDAGAGPGRRGRLEEAAGGTLFLDEIGETSLPVQAKLVRLLQERVFVRAGGAEALPADVRLVVATERSLEREAAEGRFREDLYYRLNVFPIVLPPLRERADDIPLLITEINARLQQERGETVRLSPAAASALQRYAWPHNVRELAQLIERLARLHDGGVVEVEDLPVQYRAARAHTVTPGSDGPGLPLPTLPAEGMKLKAYLSNVEYALIVQALTRTGGVVAHAAQLLGLRRTTLVEKLHKYGVRRDAGGSLAAGLEASEDEAAAG